MKKELKENVNRNLSIDHNKFQYKKEEILTLNCLRSLTQQFTWLLAHNQ